MGFDNQWNASKLDQPRMRRLFLNPYPAAQPPRDVKSGMPLVNITAEYRERVVFPAPSQEEFAAVAMLSSFQESYVPPPDSPPPLPPAHVYRGSAEKSGLRRIPTRP